MNLLTNNAAEYKAVRTSLQAFAAFVGGLIYVIWHTPGVPHNVAQYLAPYETSLFLWLGIPTVIGSGVFAYIMAKVGDKQNQPKVNIVEPPVVETPLAEGGASETPAA